MRTSKFSERLKIRMIELEISAAELSRRMSLSEAVISQYKSGKYEPKQDRLEEFAKVLNVSEAWLMGYDVSKERAEPTPYEQLMKKIPLFVTPVSAGTGQWLAEGHEYELVEFEDIPNNADYALKVRGDSMEPMYSDGDIIFVKMNVIVESGQIGVFFMDGEGYMKMLQGNKLVSLNPKYAPITISENASFLCGGRVIGKHTP